VSRANGFRVMKLGAALKTNGGWKEKRMHLYAEQGDY